MLQKPADILPVTQIRSSVLPLQPALLRKRESHEDGDAGKDRGERYDGGTEKSPTDQDRDVADVLGIAGEPVKALRLELTLGTHRLVRSEADHFGPDGCLRPAARHLLHR